MIKVFKDIYFVFQPDSVLLAKQFFFDYFDCAKFVSSFLLTLLHLSKCAFADDILVEDIVLCKCVFCSVLHYKVGGFDDHIVFVIYLSILLHLDKPLQ